MRYSRRTFAICFALSMFGGTGCLDEEARDSTEQQVVQVDDDAQSERAEGLVRIASRITGPISFLNLSGAAGEWRDYYVDLPAAAYALSAEIAGGSGDADLYMQWGGFPQLDSYYCRPYTAGNNESCFSPWADEGRWFISIHGFTAYAGVYLTIVWSQ